jgi:4-amino-4-deoxy-L-arabinose transferase-like glycosyltransferase
VLAAVAGIPLIYLLGCELGGFLLGLGEALFLAVDNMYFLAARTVRPETFVASFSIAGLLLFLYSLRRSSVLLALLGGLLVGIGVLGHPNALAAATSAGIFALVEFGPSIIRRARPYAFVAGLLLAIVPFVAWGLSTPVRRANFIRTYTEGEGQPLSHIPALEVSRYKDFIGIANSRFSLPVPIPYRLHIVIAIFASFAILFLHNRKLFWQLVAIIVPCMFWWAFIRFESVRYTATASPYFAMLFAGAALTLWERRPKWRRSVLAAAAGLFVIQIVSNYAVLYMYRTADYSDVGRRLEAIIPRNAGVYGAFTFWMALNDHTYFSWNRAPLRYAIEHGAEYLVLNDRVLLRGSGFGKDDWVHVRKAAAELIGAGGATLVGRVPNAFYGDLEVYRVTRPVAR